MIGRCASDVRAGEALGRPLTVVFAGHEADLLGAERSLLDIARWLRKDGRIEPIVTLPREGVLASELRADSIPVHVLPTPWWAVAPSGRRFSLPRPAGEVRCVLAFVPSLVAWTRWLRRQQPDVLVTNTAVIGTPALAGKLAGVPHIWWLHEFVTQDHRMSYVLGETLAQRTIGRLSGCVIANSNAVRDHYSPPIPDKKMRVVYQAITGFRPTPNQAGPLELRALVLCSLLPSKGVEMALEAARLLAAGLPGEVSAERAVGARARSVDLRLRIVGPGAPWYRRRLQRLVRDKDLQHLVEIAEATDSVQEELDWANVLLMCSDREAFGRVTVEALMSGRPVIGTRSGGTLELVTHGVNGLLFTPGDAHALASALNTLACDPALLRTMSANATASTEGRFTVEQQGESMVALLTRAAADGRRGRWRT